MSEQLSPLEKEIRERAKQLHIDAEAQKLLTQTTAPDYSSHMKDGWQLHKERKVRGPINWAVQQILPKGSTAILVAPTNIGGSTLQSHLTACMLTGQPFMGTFPVDSGPKDTVLWINPEEMEEEPEVRLVRQGLGKAELQRFHQFHTRNVRWYANQGQHIEQMLTGLDAKGWREQPPVLLVVDGLGPTLSGNPWNEDLEAWKNGMGQIIEALQPVVTLVRVQTGSGTARYSQGRGDGKEGESVNFEDAIGGQIGPWPDIRLTINRRKGGGRSLSVRGRKDQPFDVAYDFDERTWTPVKVDFSQEMKAALVMAQVMRNPESLPNSLNKLVDLMLTTAASSGMSDVPSESAFKRVVRRSAWAFDEERGLWIDASWETADDEE